MDTDVACSTCPPIDGGATSALSCRLNAWLAALLRLTVADANGTVAVGYPTCALSIGIEVSR